MVCFDFKVLWVFSTNWDIFKQIIGTLSPNQFLILLKVTFKPTTKAFLKERKAKGRKTCMT